MGFTWDNKQAANKNRRSSIQSGGDCGGDRNWTYCVIQASKLCVSIRTVP